MNQCESVVSERRDIVNDEKHLIERSFAVNHLRKMIVEARARGDKKGYEAYSRIRKFLMEAPAVEAEPVIHAKWLVIDSAENIAACSHCGHTDVIVPGAISCRFCRAKMDLTED